MNFKWPLINDNITPSDRKELANFILSNKRLTNGEKVKEFEGLWSDWLGTKYSVMVNSGASGNFISIAMVKELVGTGEVIVPPLGWTSDISSVIQLGMTPVFVDVSLSNLAITAENIEKAITKDTKAIVLVHCLGFNGINEKIISLAKKHNLLLIEDCCESHGTTFNGQKIGTFGDISIFSFYFGHHITTIEGGTVCVKDEKLYDLAKLFRSHGMTREASSTLQEQYQKQYPHLNPLFTFAVPGFNMRSTELNGVLGIEQIKRLDYNIQRRTENLHLWLNLLDTDKYFTDFDVKGSSNFALPLVLQENFKHNLKTITKILDDEGVEYRLGMAGGGNQALQPYVKKHKHKIIDNLTNSDYVHHYSLYIGNHTDLTDEQIVNLTTKLNNV